MKKIFFTAALIMLSGIFFNPIQAQKQKEGIRLLIRGDDIGSFHAANIACIRSYTDGIMQSVEVMVPCAWYPEAVVMLNENPGLDVGIHLVLTSEWENVKWRPLTGKSSITDEKGYFYPMVWPNDNFPPERAFRESNWKLEDVEKELRAQIELAKSEIRGVSHISSHMGFTSAAPEIDSLVKALASEYELNIETGQGKVQRFPFSKPKDYNSDAAVAAFISSLRELKPGTYLFVEHPSLDNEEMKTVGHIGYFKVGKDRQMVTDLFTSKVLMQEIKKLGVELIGYDDL